MSNNHFSALVVEDETNIANYIVAILTANKYDVLQAHDGSQALMMISSHCPDVVILDLGLPDMDGQNIIKLVRTWTQVPIVVVSARTHERDKVMALDLGADDYITKPFGTSELLARVRTALRHVNMRDVNTDIRQAGMFTCGDLTIDYDKRQVCVCGADVHLTQNEYKIIALLSQNAGRVLTYDYIFKSIWGPSANGDNQVLRVHMANIRRKIEQNAAAPRYVFTEMGVGYRMAQSD
ncbi:MAG: response regulator transcription factor [Clostridia bacterium]